MAFNWICPFCNRHTTISSDNIVTKENILHIYNCSDGSKKITCEWIVCPNEECRKATLTVMLQDAELSFGNWKILEDTEKIWKLIPKSNAKPYPEYIPLSIRQDYEEACAIVNDSAKASATLSRRCLQGMIRNFWGSLSQDFMMKSKP